MRLFIAIDLNGAMRREVGTVLSALRERACGGRFEPLENTHVTLRFLGESNDLAGAVAAMHEACRGIHPFTLRLGSYGCFLKGNGSRGSGRTSYLNVEGDLDELGILHETLESALYDRGFSRDQKHFVPHITLGRNVEHDELVGLELADIKPVAEMTVTELTLFESTRIKGRMVYTPLHRESF